jgi:hypothetical protein
VINDWKMQILNWAKRNEKKKNPAYTNSQKAEELKKVGSFGNMWEKLRAHRSYFHTLRSYLTSQDSGNMIMGHWTRNRAMAFQVCWGQQPQLHNCTWGHQTQSVSYHTSTLQAQDLVPLFFGKPDQSNGRDSTPQKLKSTRTTHTPKAFQPRI